MNADWHIYTLGELGKIITGKTPPAKIPNAFNGDTPFVTPRDMDGRRWVDTTERYLSDMGLNVVRSSLVPRNSVAVSCIGSDMGKAVLLARESVTNQQINTIIVDQARFNPLFIYYDLSLRQQELKGMASGSATPILNKGHFAKVEIRVPDKELQNKIVDVVSSLDDKIEHNCRINQTLEQIAQALFKSWFVDFDPVKSKIKAKQIGNDPERAAMCAISGKNDEDLDQLTHDQREQLASTAALFPDEIVDSELGLIPSGWSLKALYETAEYINGAAFKSQDFSDEKDGLPIVKIAELKQGITAQTKFTTGVFKEKYLIDNDDVLYSWSGSPETSLEVFKWFGGEGWLNQHIFKLNFENNMQKYFTYYLLKQIKPLLIQTAKNKQTTGLGHVTVSDMKRIKIPFPDTPVLSAFARAVGLLFEEDSALKQQNDSLSRIRDTLLPKLLSGQLIVTDKTGLKE